MVNTVAKCKHRIKIDCYTAGKLYVSCRDCDYKGWCYVDQFNGESLLLPVLQPLLMPLLVKDVERPIIRVSIGNFSRPLTNSLIV